MLSSFSGYCLPGVWLRGFSSPPPCQTQCLQRCRPTFFMPTALPVARIPYALTQTGRALGATQVSFWGTETLDTLPWKQDAEPYPHNAWGGANGKCLHSPCRFNFDEGTPPTNFDTFPAAIMTVFQVWPSPSLTPAGPQESARARRQRDRECGQGPSLGFCGKKSGRQGAQVEDD